MKFTEAESRRVVTRGQVNEEIGSYCRIDRESQSCKMKNVLEMDGGDGCPKLCMYLISQNLTLKYGQYG